MMEDYRDGQRLLAVVIRSGFTPDSSRFVTPPDWSLQVGFHGMREGKVIKPHEHGLLAPSPHPVQEFLFVKRGRIKVNLGSSAALPAASFTLEAGDSAILVDGRHGFEVLEDLEMIEVKQGPFSSAADGL